MGVTGEVGTDYPSGVHAVTRSRFSWVRVIQTLAFCVVLCLTLFIFLTFFFWPPSSICVFMLLLFYLLFSSTLWSMFQLTSTNRTTIYYPKSPKTNKTHDMCRMVIRFMVWDNHKHVTGLNQLMQSHLGNNCIVFENLTASIGDLMVANWVNWRFDAVKFQIQYS